MFCRQARRGIADLMEGTASPRRQAALARHLEGCAACRHERDAMTAIATQVRLAAPAAPPASPAHDDLFAARVLAMARSRSAASDRTAVETGPFATGRARGRPVVFRAATMLPVAVAASLLLFATIVAFVYGGWRNVPANGPAASALVAEFDRDDASFAGAADVGDDTAFDTLLPPREVLFSVRQDLVGVRNGRIPLTTYVLEPPPEEGAVVRASF